MTTGDPISPEQKHSFWRPTPLKVLGFAAGSLLVGGLSAYIYALGEAKRFAVETVRVTTGGAKPGGNGKIPHEGNGGAPARNLRILHISDLHLHGADEDKAEFLQTVTDDDYDIVVLTGDIFEKYGGIKYAPALLARQPRIGAFAVLGNHDYFEYNLSSKVVSRITGTQRKSDRLRDVKPMIKALKEVGYHVLQNESVAMPEHELFVVGIDWPSVNENRLRELIAPAPDDHFRLALFHLPINLGNMQRAGFHLGVGGHTHGGQVRLPFWGALITDSELGHNEASGLVWRGDTAFHISRGLGADPRTNFRFLCPPAVTVLEVEHPSAIKSRA